MTSLVELLGRRVVSRASADGLGELHGIVVDGPTHAIVAFQIGKGRKARFISHGDIRAVGPDAIVVDDESVLHSATGAGEEATAKGQQEILGSAVLTSTGVSLGTVTDVDLDLDAALVGAVTADGGTVPGARMLGFGSFALVVDVA